MKMLPKNRMSPEERALVRAIKADVARFASLIEPHWPDVDVDVCLEQLCSLAGHPFPDKLDAKARKSVISMVIQSRGKVDLGTLLIKQSRFSERRKAKRARKLEPPKPKPKETPANHWSGSLVAVPEHALVLASLPEANFNKLPEWRSLRMYVLRRSGGRCEMCGASREDVRLEARYIIPRFYAPERAFDPSNLKTLCPACSGDGGWTRQTAWEGRN